MKTIIIVAMTRDRVIGKDGRIPWHEPDDLKHFKRTTTGHAIIMGRKTYDSIGRPLPGRRNIVITRNPDYAPPAVQSSIINQQSSIDVVHSLDGALDLCRRRDEKMAFIIGGAQIYELALPLADELLVTQIPNAVAGDTFFPEWKNGDWEQTAETEAGHLKVVTFRRVGNSA